MDFLSLEVVTGVRRVSVLLALHLHLRGLLHRAARFQRSHDLLVLGGRLLQLALDANEIHDAAVHVPKGRHEELVPEGGAIGLVVQQANRRIYPSSDARADDGDLLRVRVGTLEEAAISPEDLSLRVPRQRHEALGGVHDGIVWQLRVRDHEALLRRGQHLHELVVRALQHLSGLGGRVRDDVRHLRVALPQQLTGSIRREVRLHHILEHRVLALQLHHLTLQALEEELLAQARSSREDSVALASLLYLLSGALPFPLGLALLLGRLHGRGGGPLRRASRLLLHRLRPAGLIGEQRIQAGEQHVVIPGGEEKVGDVRDVSGQIRIDRVHAHGAEARWRQLHGSRHALGEQKADDLNRRRSRLLRGKMRTLSETTRNG
mmetsp:Transcript_14820/g.56066  ORF Transcript_14820/g.56066 Transcript_14820/m.56066 type:complete len:377 (-) Transcript_14820:153-1283(-)